MIKCGQNQLALSAYIVARVLSSADSAVLASAAALQHLRVPGRDGTRSIGPSKGQGVTIHPLRIQPVRGRASRARRTLSTTTGTQQPAGAKYHQHSTTGDYQVRLFLFCHLDGILIDTSERNLSKFNQNPIKF